MIETVPSLWVARAKASAIGGLAACLIAPMLFFGTVLTIPPASRGYWQSSLNVLYAAPGIWLFSAVVSLPTSLLLGPPLLALSFRLSHPRISAIVLGAILGASVVNGLALLAGGPGAVNIALSGFAAALGAFGAGLASMLLRRQQGAVRGSANAA